MAGNQKQLAPETFDFWNIRRLFGQTLCAEKAPEISIPSTSSVLPSQFKRWVKNFAAIRTRLVKLLTNLLILLKDCCVARLAVPSSAHEASNKLTHCNQVFVMSFSASPARIQQLCRVIVIDKHCAGLITRRVEVHHPRSPRQLGSTDSWRESNNLQRSPNLQKHCRTNK